MLLTPIGAKVGMTQTGRGINASNFKWEEKQDHIKRHKKSFLETVSQASPHSLSFLQEATVRFA